MELAAGQQQMTEGAFSLDESVHTWFFRNGHSSLYLHTHGFGKWSSAIM